MLAAVLLLAWAPALGRTLKVGVYENAPKIFTDESGRAAGIFVDILEAIASEEGWDLEYVPGTWGEGLDRLERGEIDLMPDVAHTAGREVIYAFHREPVLSSWFQVYTRRGEGVGSILDLEGKRVVVLERSVQEEAFRQLAQGFQLDVTVIAEPDYARSFERVANGEADAAVTNRFYGMMHARQYGLVDTTVMFQPSNLFYAAPLGGDRGVLEAIDRRLRAMKADASSVYYGALERWTAEEVEYSLPAWARIAGVVALCALVMTGAGAWVLKQQVDVRTRELRAINHGMEMRIEERTAELAAAMERAQEADRLKSAFLATMSHELRTPLNSIIGFTGILLQELAGPLNEAQKKQMRMAQGSARHLLALINDVLDISKIEAGELVLSPSEFALRDSVEKVAGLVAPSAEKKGVGLEGGFEGEPGTMEADQRRLEQVLLNLLSNAIKFTDAGGVVLRCTGGEEDVELAVSDTGIGIAEEDMAKLFRPFRQVDTGLARKHEGTGLGLSICKRLVEKMGGAITAESTPGRGSTFRVRLPRRAGGTA